mmetsp:Transcript_126805/g.364720  ORF Transcript_126805/g.364720 Transcript_126805/m.364720 type:complete len:427 (+) Transcript_126805:95-1375(+)
MLAPSPEEMLPRRLPFVGLLRHAPPQALKDVESCSPMHLAHQATADGLVGSAGGGGHPPTGGAAAAEASGEPKARRGSQEALQRRLRESPYIGFCRHAPPSPVLNFSRNAGMLIDDAAHLDFPLLAGEAEPRRPAHLLGRLPVDLWAAVLCFVASPAKIPELSRLSVGFREAIRHPVAWMGTTVRLAPAAVPALASTLAAWSEAWQSAAKLVVPRSSQLHAELGRLLPHVPLEVAWRFDSNAMGDGLELVRGGAAVRRVPDEDGEGDVVVVGDAPLVVEPGRPPYMEVCLEAFASCPCGDGMNEFGLGFTACNPEELQELGSVAAEVPNSWVVDFTRTMVCLSVNNCEEAKGYSVCSDGLAAGDRVGLGVSPQDGAVEVYVNGELRDRLRVPPDCQVPMDARLYPVLDLFGRVAQISRTDADSPSK